MNNRLPTNLVVLNSWKEIATYLGRGVRTVQRWERELGLPIRRPRGKDRSAVMAFQHELDDWLRHSSSTNTTRHEFNSDGRAKLQKNADTLRARTDELLSRSRRLWLQVNYMRQLASTIRAKKLGLSVETSGTNHFFNTRHFKPETLDALTIEETSSRQQIGRASGQTKEPTV
jgi:hypothetical protein